MNKNVLYFMLGIIFLLSAGTTAYAETGQKCAEDCVAKCLPLTGKIKVLLPRATRGANI